MVGNKVITNLQWDEASLFPNAGARIILERSGNSIAGRLAADHSGIFSNALDLSWRYAEPLGNIPCSGLANLIHFNNLFILFIIELSVHGNIILWSHTHVKCPCDIKERRARW